MNQEKNNIISLANKNLEYIYIEYLNVCQIFCKVKKGDNIIKQPPLNNLNVVSIKYLFFNETNPTICFDKKRNICIWAPNEGIVYLFTKPRGDKK
jgi:hypothetical protein